MTTVMFRRTALLAVVFVSACGGDEQAPEPRQLTHVEYADAIRESALVDTMIGTAWLDAADTALTDPEWNELPHDERGLFLPHETRALGTAFAAVEGQTLYLHLELSPDSDGRLYAELFRIGPDRREPDFLPVATPGAPGRHVIEIPASGDYILRLQPELHARIDYRLKLELDAALRFPVNGHTGNSVGSVFGDPREGGRRRHEGVDIFAARHTPVVAAADGTAIARRTAIGGNTVWLRLPGKSLYYAHLETVAISGRQRVVAGELLGTVGNTGNARTTPPHLHFGIYRRGIGAVDPMPFVRSRRFASEPRRPELANGFAVVATAGLNLRPGPSTRQPAIAQLEAGAAVRIVGATQEWLRVRLADGEAGWIHRNYQRAPGEGQPEASPSGPRWLFAEPGASQVGEPGGDNSSRAAAIGSPMPIGRIRAGAPVFVFASAGDWRLVGSRPNTPLGWSRRPES